MKPAKPLPYDDSFSSPDAYIDSLLTFTSTTPIFQVLCGGVHVLDFFTHDGGLFPHIVPPEWQAFLRTTEPMRLLDLLMRDDLSSCSSSSPPTWVDAEGSTEPRPGSLIRYIQQIRLHALDRTFSPVKPRLPVLPRHVAVGMKPKKLHEVTHFADYVDRLAETVDAVRADSPQESNTSNHESKEVGEKQEDKGCPPAPISHLVDFGSGQNYLGRTLACEPYNRHIVAVESRESNISGAKELDMVSGIAKREKVMRNKKLWQQVLDFQTPTDQLSEKAQQRATKAKIADDPEADLRPIRDLKAIYEKPEEGKGFIHYISGRLEHGDLSEVITKLKKDVEGDKKDRLGLMGVSIHSCGNLSHYGIRSLILNPDIKAIAIVGCCYNLLTEKLGPPKYSKLYMRPSLQAINGRVMREAERRDPQGFPLSEKLSTYGGEGIKLNITARMMAVQAAYNWTEIDSEGFFTRHFFRAVLQKMFLDKGVISRVYFGAEEDTSREESAGDGETGTQRSPFNMSTNPIIIGSLRKSCYTSFHAYVRGAIAKLMTDSGYVKYSPVVEEKMSGVTDEEISGYEAAYRDRKRELSSIWSLMAFSAGVVESMIVADRWLFLREHGDVVKDCWVEAVFDYGQSPRNLVVVGVKR